MIEGAREVRNRLAGSRFYGTLAMQVIDYNGPGSWSRDAILARYKRYATRLGIVPRDLAPDEHTEGGRRWVYPVMLRVIDGIKTGDAGCVEIGIEFIEDDSRFAFGRTLKSNAARALRRALLSVDDQARIRRRVFDMLRRGQVPREYREYAKLVRKIGFTASEIPELAEEAPAHTRARARAMRFRSYFDRIVRELH